MHNDCLASEKLGRESKSTQMTWSRSTSRKIHNLLQPGDVVLVRVPWKYRSSIDYLFGRKGIIIHELVGENGIGLNSYKVRWCETGGIRSDEKPWTLSQHFISSRDLKRFSYGDDKLTENTSPTIEDHSDPSIQYNHEDYVAEMSVNRSSVASTRAAAPEQPNERESQLSLNQPLFPLRPTWSCCKHNYKSLKRKRKYTNRRCSDKRRRTL